MSPQTDPVPGVAQGAPTARQIGPKEHFVYVLRCADGTLYAGYATDVERRLAEHQSGRGAKYTRARRPVAIVARWPQTDRSSALRAEAAFKRLTRAEKLARIAAAHLQFLDRARFDHPTAGPLESASGALTVDLPNDQISGLPTSSATQEV